MPTCFGMVSRIVEFTSASRLGRSAKKTGQLQKRIFWKRYHIENYFVRLTGGRGIVIRYERRGYIFFYTINLTEIIIF